MPPNDIWKLYQDGKIEAALAAVILSLDSEVLDEATQQELHGIKAWCHYRRKEYDQALTEISQAGTNARATRCHVYVLAYAAGHTDDGKLFSLVSQLGRDVDACNALVIRARAKESSLTHEQVWALAEYFVQTANVSEQNVSVANLLHNTARFYLDKARNRADLKFALGILEAALAHYGQVSNWHHRAAAYFWQSILFEGLTAIPQAFEAAAASLRCWKCQCELEKNTGPFKDKLATAVKRVQELAQKVSDFALQSGMRSA